MRVSIWLSVTLILAGCGRGPLVAASASQGAIAAQSKAAVTKGVHAVFQAGFALADANQDNRLTPDELPIVLPMAEAPRLVGADPAADAADRAALMKALDLNGDGQLTYREFARPETTNAAIATFRAEAARTFAKLDVNGDHALTEAELAPAGYAFMDFDKNANGKLTGSEFEDGLIKKFGKQPEPAPDGPASGSAPVITSS